MKVNGEKLVEILKLKDVTKEQAQLFYNQTKKENIDLDSNSLELGDKEIKTLLKSSNIKRKKRKEIIELMYYFMELNYADKKEAKLERLESKTGILQVVSIGSGISFVIGIALNSALSEYDPTAFYGMINAGLISATSAFSSIKYSLDSDNIYIKLLESGYYNQEEEKELVR